MNADTKRTSFGQRVIAGAALVVALVCGWSGIGFRTAPTGHDVTFITNTARPALSVQPMPVYAPQLGAMEDYPMIEFTPSEVILALLSIVTMCIAIIAIIRSGGNADARFVELMKERQNDRATMEVYEKGYAAANEAIKGAVSIATSVLRVFENTIPGNADTAVRKFLEDVQSPGAPVVDALPADPPAVG